MAPGHIEFQWLIAANTASDMGENKKNAALDLVQKSYRQPQIMQKTASDMKANNLNDSLSYGSKQDKRQTQIWGKTKRETPSYVGINMPK